MKLLDLACHLKPQYVPDWYHHTIAEHLDRLLAGDPAVPNLLVSTPPGSGKTELISILFPAHIFVMNAGAHVIALANSDSLARMLSANVLRLVQHPEFQAIRPLLLDKASESQWTISGNDGRPSMHAAGIGGQLTGHRADFLIFDDLLKSQSDAYSETIREKIWADFGSAAETRLLPEGKIVGVQTRWHLDDPIGRLLRRAQEDRLARQFVYISLAAWNSGNDSFILDTRRGEAKLLPPYKALATKPGQPYSFSRKQLLGKQADLGSSRFSALYQQQPLSGEDQLFPENVWRTLESLDIEDLQLVVSAWDCANKTGEKNDYSANVVVARLNSGGFVVLDVWKSKLNFAELPQVVMERYQLLIERYRTLPLLAIEDAAAGTQLLDTVRDCWPQVPVLAAKPVKAKIIRAEGVTPITTGGLVALPRHAEWRNVFIAELANFPVGVHDDVVDAFCHAIKSFTTARDFRTPDLQIIPGRLLTNEEVWEQEREELEFRMQTAISPDLDRFDYLMGNW
jgi:predicted phage terminase large subunit-like protein